MLKYKLLIARFPYGAQEHPDVVDWLLNETARLAKDPRFQVRHWRIDDTPITMGRNRCLEVAKKEGVDFVLMVDSDMAPDLYIGNGDLLVQPFLPTALDFALKHPGPCAIAAPYGGPPPHENVYVFHWLNRQSDHPDVDLELNQYTREHAATLAGIQEVAALPTGLFLLDMRALNAITPPYFYYEFENDGARCPACLAHEPGVQTHKASTEDVTFTRDLSLAGVKVYAHWSAWAGHWKRKCVGKPQPFSVDLVAGKLREAWSRGWHSEERLVDVPEGGLRIA